MAAAAGWYDDGSGRQRWWDGSVWTDRFLESERDDGSTASLYEKSVQPASTGSTSSDFFKSLGAKMTQQHDPTVDTDALWAAVGKPLSGLGAGRYKLTAAYLLFEKGTLSTKSQQIGTHEIFDVDAAQTMTQKARGVGNITLWAKRASGTSEKVILEDIPNFREGVAAINHASHEARERILLRDKTTHVNYTGGIPAHHVPTPASAPAPTATLDLNTELAKLAAFKEQGILDDAEFAAAKKKLLGI